MMIATGGDDITKTFASFLLANRFPYSDINLTRAYDWRLAQELKEKWCTMNEADISVQVYDFFVRVPHRPTKKFQCKVYDEVFLAPLCLVYPAILNAKEKTKNTKIWSSSNVIDDIADEAHVSYITFNMILFTYGVNRRSKALCRQYGNLTDHNLTRLPHQSLTTLLITPLHNRPPSLNDTIYMMCTQSMSPSPNPYALQQDHQMIDSRGSLQTSSLLVVVA